MTILNRRRFLAISAAALATPAAATPIRWRGFALGADISLTIRAPSRQAENAIRATKKRLRDVEALFSLYDPSSTLSVLNRQGFLRNPPSEFQALLALCDAAHKATDGCFDPTIQSLWGTSPAPQAVGWHKVRLSPDVALAEGQSITLNGIAQGFATDLVRDAFTELGLTDTLINMGEFSALGGPFTLGLADPQNGLFDTLTLENRAVATSSPGAMQLQGAPHIRNPKAESSPHWATVSVQAASTAWADALSTAFCVMPLPAIKKCLKRQPKDIQVTLLSIDGTVTRL